MKGVTADSAETRELLARVEAGEPGAFERLFAQHRDLLHRIIQAQMDQQLRRRLDGSDVLQEIQIEVSRRMPDYLDRRPLPFRLWLRKTARERMLNLRRRQVHAQPRAAGREVPLPDRTSLQIARQLLGAGSSPSQRLEKRELAGRVRQAISKLAHADREILLIRYFEALSYEETACILGIEPAAARKRHGRALLRLHKVLRAAGLSESQL